METDLTREELHVLLDRIPESDVPTARKFLRALADPFERALLNAPLDAEPLSAHEQAAWEGDQRRRELGRPATSHEELLAELGISEASLR